VRPSQSSVPPTRCDGLLYVRDKIIKIGDILNIAIVGGGTAGWLTALYAKKIYPNKNIILIESEEIGILGAGEGSTPKIVSFFDFLEIPLSDLIKNCNVTIKNGIKFTNWSKTNYNYFHPFAAYNEIFNSKQYLEFETSYSHILASKFNHNFKDYCFMKKLSDKNLVPFQKTKYSLEQNPILNFQQHAQWSIHFNAKEFAEYLRKIAESRGIVRIEGIVNKIGTDENEYINNLLVNDQIINVDFVFDCTGFKRLIIGNFYNSKWKSYSDFLPAKKAIPFFLPIEKQIPPYTEAIAMNYGWMWKIPVQNRYGCGYVFDSDFISDDEAKKEIDNYLGFKVESPKTFSFNAGCYEEVWINNCLAVGLSTGFIEPLEATSILQSLNLLEDFFKLYENINCKNKKIKNKFNAIFLNEAKEISDFLYLHYITNKTNNDFWKNFTKNNLMPDFIQDVLEEIKTVPLNGFTFQNKRGIFGFENYLYVMIGNGIITKNDLKIYKNLLKSNREDEYLKMIEEQNKIIKYCFNHNIFLHDLKNE
jgi:tryptophan halogenase